MRFMLKFLNFTYRLPFYFNLEPTNKLKSSVMKNHILRIAMLLVMLLSVTSCEVIGDIFQAGMSVGIFLVILIVAIVIWIISKFRNR